MWFAGAVVPEDAEASVQIRFVTTSEVASLGWPSVSTLRIYVGWQGCFQPHGCAGFVTESQLH